MNHLLSLRVTKNATALYANIWLVTGGISLPCGFKMVEHNFRDIVTKGKSILPISLPLRLADSACDSTVRAHSVNVQPDCSVHANLCTDNSASDLRPQKQRSSSAQVPNAFSHAKFSVVGKACARNCALDGAERKK